MRKTDRFTALELKLNSVYNYFLANPKVALDYYKTVYSADSALLHKAVLKNSDFIDTTFVLDADDAEKEVKELVTHLQKVVNLFSDIVYRCLPPYQISPAVWEEPDAEKNVKKLVAHLQMHIRKCNKNLYKDLVPDNIPSYSQIIKWEIQYFFTMWF